MSRYPQNPMICNFCRYACDYGEFYLLIATIISHVLSSYDTILSHPTQVLAFASELCYYTDQLLVYFTADICVIVDHEIIALRTCPN